MLLFNYYFICYIVIFKRDLFGSKVDVKFAHAHVEMHIAHECVDGRRRIFEIVLLVKYVHGLLVVARPDERLAGNRLADQTRLDVAAVAVVDGVPDGHAVEPAVCFVVALRAARSVRQRQDYFALE